MVVFYVLIGAVAAERLAELVVARRHEVWLRARGAVEFGASHYPVMVVLHVGLLVGAPLEVVLAHRPFLAGLAWPSVAVVVLAQVLRWWCISTLGQQWNTRVLVAPRLPLVSAGPYRYLRHPNYVAVVAEGIALPLVGSAWITAIAFTALNALLLRTRIATENAALNQVAAHTP